MPVRIMLVILSRNISWPLRAARFLSRALEFFPFGATTNGTLQQVTRPVRLRQALQHPFLEDQGFGRYQLAGGSPS